jgi:hypothetical protein
MALMSCPECGKQVSDKAAACPHCGAPIAASSSSAAPRAGEPRAEHGEPVEVYNPRQDQFLTRNRGCLEVFVSLGLAILIIAGLKSCL